MEQALFLGGFKHGVLEQVPNNTPLKFAYEFPVQKPVKWNEIVNPEPTIDWYSVLYKHEGVWNSHYGYVHVYIESSCKFTVAKISGMYAEQLSKIQPALVYVIDVAMDKDEVTAFIDVETEKALSHAVFGPGKGHFHISAAGLIIPDSEFKSQAPTKQPITIQHLNEILKSVYKDQLKVQLKTEWNSALWDAAIKQVQHENDPYIYWLNAGRRDANRVNLCYECAEEIVGPGFGKVNDLLVEKGTGKRVRKLVCGNCGRGKFNRRGQRIADWPKAGI